MSKHLILICALCALYSCKETPAVPGNPNNPPVYKKSDLKKLQWIEGNWKSDVQGPGFYQTYHFPTDSTLEVVSYQLSGKDSSNTTVSTVYWKNNHLYLGQTGEWVAVLLDKKRIQFDPVRPGWPTINWTQNGPNEWTSEQKKVDFNRTIKMKRQPAMEELLKK